MLLWGYSICKKIPLHNLSIESIVSYVFFCYKFIFCRSIQIDSSCHIHLNGHSLHRIHSHVGNSLTHAAIRSCELSHHMRSHDPWSEYLPPIVIERRNEYFYMSICRCTPTQPSRMPSPSLVLHGQSISCQSDPFVESRLVWSVFNVLKNFFLCKIRSLMPINQLKLPMNGG